MALTPTPQFPSLDFQRRIAELREKGRAGTMTIEDCKEAIAFLRADRLAMPQTKASASRAKAAVVVDADDLLKDLGI